MPRIELYCQPTGERIGCEAGEWARLVHNAGEVAGGGPIKQLRLSGKPGETFPEPAIAELVDVVDYWSEVYNQPPVPGNFETYLAWMQRIRPHLEAATSITTSMPPLLFSINVHTANGQRVRLSNGSGRTWSGGLRAWQDLLETAKRYRWNPKGTAALPAWGDRWPSTWCNYYDVAPGGQVEAQDAVPLAAALEIHLRDRGNIMDPEEADQLRAVLAVVRLPFTIEITEAPQAPAAQAGSRKAAGVAR